MPAPLTEIRVSYSVGYKANMGNYESADVHLSETYTYDVSELDTDASEKLSKATYEALKVKLDQRLLEVVEELKS